MKNTDNKASILTWCYNNGKTNYGQILQCYAMQELVRMLGYDPIVIRYRKPDVNENVPEDEADRDKYELSYRYEKVEGKKDERIQRFISFIKEHISLSKQCYSKKEVSECCKDSKAVFCGSDQIWNPLGFDDIYALNFETYNAKKIAYAPSGISVELDGWKDKLTLLGSCLNSFDLVTVREEESMPILRKYTEKSIEAVMDPTLLIPVQKWDSIAGEQLSEEPYIFCYSLGRLRENKVMLRYLLKKYNARKVLFITSGFFPNEDELEEDDLFKAVKNAGPAEFISLIKHAETVCTDSFHGLVFSIAYKKQFYIFRRHTENANLWGNMNRQRNLLKKTGIEDRYVRSCKEIDGLRLINYEEIDYSNERARILTYLQEVIA